MENSGWVVLELAPIPRGLRPTTIASMSASGCSRTSPDSEGIKTDAGLLVLLRVVLELAPIPRGLRLLTASCEHRSAVLELAPIPRGLRRL